MIRGAGRARDLRPAAAAVILVFAAASGPAGNTTGCLSLFPDAQMPLKPDGGAQTISFDTAGTIEIDPVRFAPLPGHSVAFSTTWCGVVLRQAGERQGVVTVGTGITDALSCGHLLEAGALPEAGETLRLGLVYRTASPNASVITPIVLARRGRGALWAVDADVSQRLTLLPGGVSLDGMRRALQRP
jgi:hypothetical protein